ncbi:MAG: mechanosensitive ion channel family protein [Nitrosopumilaceae archaeon]
MAEEDVIGTVSGQVGQFQSVGELLASSVSFQIALAILVVGLIGIAIAYRKFSKWVKSKKFYYSRPHVARTVRVVVLPFFAIALVSSTNAYIQTFELFDEITPSMDSEVEQMTPSEVFAKLLNTFNILVIGHAIAHLIPIALTKREKSILEREDYEAWKELRGFPDDSGDLFHKFFKWITPKTCPEDLTDAEFKNYLKTEEGRKYLEGFRTSKGVSIGSYEQLIDNPFEEWKKAERAKYEKYYQACVTGKNESGKKLRPGQEIEEIYPIDTWREEKRMGGYESIIPGARQPGYSARKRKDLPKSVTQILPIGIFVAVIIGVISWWGVDLIVLATATGGLAIGVGLALQETMQNWFAYIMIRKDKIFVEGDRVQLDTGYNGYVHKITPRVTYVRHGLNESFAVIPTRQLVNAQIINYSKELKMVPAVVDVGVSYLNNPRQVASILVKVGKRAMKEVVDDRGRHLIVQKRCPYVEQNKPSCGCDRDIHVDITEPVVRFNKFNDSSLDFSMWVYVRDYGSQFKTKTDMRMIMYEEFKKYDIRIPWPIRTVYQGDEKRESEEIGKLDEERNEVFDEFGAGDIAKGGAED